MGDIADAIINGDFDASTGEWIGPGDGFPRSYDPKHPDFIGRKRKSFKKYKQKNVRSGKGGIGQTVDVQIKGTILKGCVIADYLNTKRKRYVVVDREGKQHRVQYSQLCLINKKVKND